MRSSVIRPIPRYLMMALASGAVFSHHRNTKLMVVGKNAAMRKGLFSRSQCRGSDDAAIIFT